jgi:Tol biopolymer transport system component
VTVTAPPRPPRSSDPVDREEIEALVEALFEEARQRARRRRRIYAASVTLLALAVVTVSRVVDRATQPDIASPALAARSSGLAGAATPKIAFIREPPRGGYAGVLWVMNRDGSGQRRLADAFGGMRWSPDGQKIAFTAWSAATSDVFVMNADGSGKQKLTSGDSWESGVAWSPDGPKIAFVRGFGGDSGIYVMNADGSGQRRLTSEASSELAWSPLGNKIAFMSRRDGNAEIYVMNADGSQQRNLTRNTVGDRNPVWSPDGRRIAFESNWQVNIMNADGSGQRRLTRNGARNFSPAWSPDGRKIAFERRVGRVKYGPCNGCGRASNFEVHVINADGTKERTLAKDGARPSWSPDAQTVAFDRQSDIYVMNADGSGQRNLTKDAVGRHSQPVWSPAQR